MKTYIIIILLFLTFINFLKAEEQLIKDVWIEENKDTFTLNTFLSKNISGIFLKITTNSHNMTLFYNNMMKMLNSAVPIGFSFKCNNSTFKSIGVDSNLNSARCDNLTLLNKTKIKDFSKNYFLIKWIFKKPFLVNSINIYTKNLKEKVNIKHYSINECQKNFKDFMKYPIYNKQEIFKSIKELREEFIKECLIHYNVQNRILIPFVLQKKLIINDYLLRRWLSLMEFPKKYYSKRAEGCYVNIINWNRNLNIYIYKINKEKYEKFLGTKKRFHLNNGLFELKLTNNNTSYYTKSFICQGGIEIYFYNLFSLESRLYKQNYLKNKKSNIKSNYGIVKVKLCDYNNKCFKIKKGDIKFIKINKYKQLNAKVIDKIFLPSNFKNSMIYLSPGIYSLSYNSVKVEQAGLTYGMYGRSKIFIIKANEVKDIKIYLKGAI